jgi:hypothetical protein
VHIAALGVPVVGKAGPAERQGASRRGLAAHAVRLRPVAHFAMGLRAGRLAMRREGGDTADWKGSVLTLSRNSRG